MNITSMPLIYLYDTHEHWVNFLQHGEKLYMGVKLHIVMTVFFNSP